LDRSTRAFALRARIVGSFPASKHNAFSRVFDEGGVSPVLLHRAAPTECIIKYCDSRPIARCGSHLSRCEQCTTCQQPGCEEALFGMRTPFFRPIIAKIACSRHRSYADSKVGRLFQLRPLVPLCPFSSIALGECSSTLSAARSLTDAGVPGSTITLSRTETAAPAVRYSVESFTSYERASAHRIHETGAGRFPGARNRP
jgi:hypothetical protein